MKFFTSLVSYGLIATSMVSAIAIPVAAPRDAQLSKRQLDGPGVVALIDGLTATVKEAAASVDVILGKLPENPTDADKATAAADVNEILGQITAAVTDATSKVPAPSTKRQLPGLPLNDLAAALGLALANLLAAVSNLLTTIVNALGYPALSLAIIALVASLQGLIAALLAVVSQLLIVVAGILLSLGVVLNPLLAPLGIPL